MKKYFYLFLFFLTGLSLINAQSGLKHFSVQSLKTVNNVFKKDTLKILAVMVDFQPDKYDGTTGTGKFGSNFTQDYKESIIDPLPHDSNYFANHLEFAKNYFYKVSNGKLFLTYTVLPHVITVSKMMREYAQQYKSTDLTPVASFCKESWQAAFRQYASVNFKNYDLFIIFHAGISNSLNTGTYEISRDLPAIYLGGKVFTTVFGSNFTGLVDTGAESIINNSIVMPETESREQTSIDNSISLLQISINGELVANIASFLGLPDLYNTDTGLSAIGRFGLMDGQAIVANQGIFPPEPSAWEKIYLGWEQPVSLNNKNMTLNLSARRSAGITDTTLIKIPISDTEYYLIENREQDALKNGIRLTYKNSHGLYTDILHPDSTGVFYFSDTNIKGGVVVDVDEFDAAVPGNGIVIWHIDDKIINNNISDDKINNGSQKGVTVVEADGIVDIGQIIYTILGDEVGEGTYQDFWYKGNDSHYYANIFSDDTQPSAKANDGLSSNLLLQNFSNYSNKMSFSISFSGTILQKFASAITLPFSPSAIITVKETTNHDNYILCGNDFLKYEADGKLLKTYSGFSHYKPAYFTRNDSNYFIGVNGKIISCMNTSTGKIKGFLINANGTAPPVIHSYSNNLLRILIGTDSGIIIKMDVDSLLANTSSNAVFSSGINLNENPIQICAAADYYSAVSENYFADINSVKLRFPNKIRLSALTIDKNGNYCNIVLTEDNYFYIITNGAIKNSFRVNVQSAITSFVLADILNNGENCIVFTLNEKLYALNLQGGVIDNYPLTLSGNKFSFSILSIHYDSDKTPYFIIPAVNGEIYFINAVTAKIVSNLSIATGTTPILLSLHAIDISPRVPPFDDLGLTYVTANNSLYSWDLKIPSPAKIWFSQFCDYSNSSFIPKALNTLTYSSVLPDGKVYNWPNPVYGQETNIRFLVNEDSDINIKIFDMGGQIVAEFNKSAAANMDIDVLWNVSNIKSGVYFARVQAITKSGKSSYKNIKIAVIK